MVKRADPVVLSEKLDTDAFVSPTFSASNRLKRLVWNVTWAILGRLSPTPLHGWRNFLLKLFGAKIGSGVHVYPSATIWAPWNLQMDDEACLGPQVNCYNVALVRLGYRAIASQGAHLCTASHDYEDPIFPLFAKPITIEKHAWVCAEAFVGPGATIHEGAVVGARAVLMKDAPAWTVWAGNPARHVKDRVQKAKSGIEI